MGVNTLDFEEPVFEIEKKIEELKALSKHDEADFSSEIRDLRRKARRMRRDIFKNLNSWQRTRLARHPDRPYTGDYIRMITTDFIELHGDRLFGDGVSIVGGFAKLDGMPVMLIGHQKGRNTKEKIYRNFGMSHPEGYRKALRLMRLAEKFGLPIVTFMDTPGAYPGVGAEERGQSEAIAKNLMEMASIRAPIVSIVIGEGGSGGALAIGVGNRVMMMENSVYSVISPEGCAAILWNDCEKVSEAADALSLTAQNLLDYKIIEEIIKEPTGGAHIDPPKAASILRRVLRRHLKELSAMTPDELVQDRRKKFRKIGEFA